VDGVFSGPIRSDSTVTIGRSGSIEGDLHADELVVTGRFSGTAICEKIRILAGGRMVGNATSSVLEIERGCVFHGRNTFRRGPGETAVSALEESISHAESNVPDNVTAIPIPSRKAM